MSKNNTSLNHIISRMVKIIVVWCLSSNYRKRLTVLMRDMVGSNLCFISRIFLGFSLRDVPDSLNYTEKVIFSSLPHIFPMSLEDTNHGLSLATPSEMLSSSRLCQGCKCWPNESFCARSNSVAHLTRPGVSRAPKPK